MLAGGWGRIINTGSMHALVASPYKSAYNAAKHGIAGARPAGRRLWRLHSYSTHSCFGSLHRRSSCRCARGRAAAAALCLSALGARVLARQARSSAPLTSVSPCCMSGAACSRRRSPTGGRSPSRRHATAAGRCSRGCGRAGLAGGWCVLGAGAAAGAAGVRRGCTRAAARAGLTKTVALETAREEQVTCNAICPGYVLTDLVRNQLEDTSRARGIPVVRGPRPAAPFFMPAQRQPCSHARCKGAPPRARDARVARVPARARKNCHGGPSGHRTRPGAARPHELQAVAEHPQACSTAACRSLTRLVRRSPGGGRRIGAGCGPMTAARPPAARRTR